MLNFRYVDDMDMLIRSKLAELPQVDCIVGVPRSGMLPATLMALYLGKPLISIEQLSYITSDKNYKYSARAFSEAKIRRILIVDDSCDSGNAMNKVKVSLALIQSVVAQFDIFYCAVYVTAQGMKHVDFYLEQVDQPRVFEWNILDHNILQRSCVDMDGVLCVDPTPEENDDNERYLAFLANAKPLFIPHYQIHSIVTCRLEKYRPMTEKWLKEHGVSYKNLYMLDLPDAHARRTWGQYSEYKADIYKKSGTELFIESECFQAQMIWSMASPKPVYCVETNQFYGRTTNV